MPTVPRYNATITQDVSRTQQRLSASPDAFGASAAQALGNVGQGLNQIAQRREEMRLEDAATSAQQAAVAARDAIREVQLGEDGYLTQSGENAVNSFEAYQERIEEIGREYGGSLRDPDAREMFDRVFQSRIRESALNSGVQHYARERRARDIQVQEATRAEASIRAVQMRGDPEEFEAAIADGVNAIQAAGRLSGAVPEAVELAVEQYRSEVVLNSISAAVDSRDGQTAQALLDSYGDSMTDAQRADARELIEDMDRSSREQAVIDEVTVNFAGDLTGARAYIRENFEGEMEDNLIARINIRFEEAEIAERDRKDDLAREALSILENGGTYDDIPQSMRSALSPEMRLTLASGRPLVTDPERYNEFLDMVSDPERVKEVAALQFEDVAVWASTQRFDQIAGVIMEARAAVAEGGAEPLPQSEYATIREQRSLLNDVLENSYGVSDPASRVVIYEELERRVERFQRENNRTITQTEINQMTAELAAEVTIVPEGERPNWFMRSVGALASRNPSVLRAQEPVTVSTGLDPASINEGYSFIEPVDPINTVTHRRASANAVARIVTSQTSGSLNTRGVRQEFQADVVEAMYNSAIREMSRRGIPVTEEALSDMMVRMYYLELQSRVGGSQGEKQ